MKKIFLLLSIAVLLSSCTSKKKVVNPTSNPEAEAAQAMESAIQRGRFEESLGKSGDFNLLQLRTKYSLGDKSLSGRLNVEMGKRLCMTVTVLGIEVARVEANDKSVVVVDKFDKLYTELSIEDFAAQFGLKDEMQYDALECLLLGRMFIPGTGEARAKDFNKLEWSIDNGLLIGELSKQKYTLSYIVDEDNRLARTVVSAQREGVDASIACTYSGYQSVENGELAMNESFALKAQNLNLKADLSLSSPIVGKAWTAFVPSAAYKKVSIQEIIAAIKNIKN